MLQPLVLATASAAYFQIQLCVIVPHLHKGVKLLDVGIGEMVEYQKSLKP